MLLPRRLVIAFCILTVLVLFVSIQYCNKKQESDSAAYFENLNLELRGKVSGKKELSHGAGLLFVDVSYSSIPYYDIRGKTKSWSSVQPYYCVVKSGKAEIIEGGLGTINIGDSVVVSCAHNSFKIIRKNTVEIERPLFLREVTIIDIQKQHLHKL